jgi:hypothetical protein
MNESVNQSINQTITSVTVTHFNHTDFNKEITTVFIQLNKWFAANLLSLNKKKNSIYAVYDKKHFCQ